MGKMADNSIIIDTNILLYLNIDNEEVKGKALQKIQYLKRDGYSLAISEQIIREFLVAKSNLQKIAHKIDFNKLREDVQYLLHNFSIIWPSFKSVLFLEELIFKYRIQGKVIHDANIVAVAKENNVFKILTNNPSDFIFALGEGFEIITL